MLLGLSILIVLVTSFFCSISEASLLSVSRPRIEAMSKQSRAAQVVARLKGTLDRPIAAILILNTIANTGGAALAGREYQRVFEGANMAIFTIALTIAVLVFAELLPKMLGVRYAERASLLVAGPMQLLIVVLRPLLWLVERGTHAVVGAGRQSPAVSLEDLRAMARLAVSAKKLGREEQMIIEAASRLPRIDVEQIMIHAEDMVILSLADQEEELLVRARRSMHTRMVLCHNDLSDVVGIVNIKEVLWRMVAEPEDLEEEGLKRIFGEAVREPMYVETGLDVSTLLELFSIGHEHIALARRDGRVVGMVTLEDVIEELIGEVDDEYDRSPEAMEAVEPGLWRFGGGTLWGAVAEALNLPAEDFLPEDLDLDGRFDLNDLAADLLRGKLRTGGVFMVGKWRFKVTRMRRGKVLRLEASLIGRKDSLARPDTSSGPESDAA